MEKFLTPEQTDEIIAFCKKWGYNLYNKSKNQCQLVGLEAEDVISELYLKFVSLDIDIQKMFFEGAEGKAIVHQCFKNHFYRLLDKETRHNPPVDDTDYEKYADKDLTDNDIESIYYNKAVSKRKYVDYGYEEIDTVGAFVDIIETLNDVERKFIICKLCLNAPDTKVAEHYWSEFQEYYSELTDEQKELLNNYSSKKIYNNDIIFKTFFDRPNGSIGFYAGQKAVKRLKKIFGIE